MVNIQKAAIIGCGAVGSAAAFSLIHRGIFSELVLIDTDRKKAEGEAMDLSHGRPFARTMEIYAGTYEDIGDCALIVIAAGANQSPGENRLELANRNTAILRCILPAVIRQNFAGILLLVTNPVDILTYAALKISGFPKERVIGSGTVLDSARFRYLLGEHLRADSRSVHAMIIGEHGDSELPVWSGANVSGIALSDFGRIRGCRDHRESLEQIFLDVRDSAYEIIARKGATSYGIAMAISRIAECIIRNEHSVLPVSSLLTGEYGLADLCISVPTIVAREGAERVLEIPLAQEERQRLGQSAAELKRVLSGIGM